MNFKDKFEQYQNIVNSELEKYLENSNVPEKILNESVQYSLMAGGKRIRPILLIDTFKLFNENFNEILTYACAIEMVHNCSLIHDDLPGIDNDDLRHGKPTNHKKFNEATAILAGDKLLNMAYILISLDFKNENSNIKLSRKIQAFNEFADAIDKMIIGEYVDTEVEWQDISKDLLEYIHKNKTGAFLKVSVRMGAILSGANEIDIENLSKYADKIGLAFQIKDDILSEEGNVEEIGKPVGNDKEAGKCTYVTIFGLEKAKIILNDLTKDAIETLESYGEKAEFLRELAIYIRDRRK